MSEFFLYSNTSGSYCLRICPTGYTPDHVSKKCVTSLVDIPAAQAAALVAAPVATSAALTISGVASGGFSVNTLLCLVATESFINMRFLNINHSNLASEIYATTSRSFISDWISAYNTLEKDKIIFDWGVFQKTEMSALYLDNFGNFLIEMLIYFGLFLLTALLIITPKIAKLTHPIGEKAHVTIFSFLMANILGKIQRQLLFSILQIIKVSYLYDKYSYVSYFAAISTMLILTGLLIYCFWQLMRIFKYQKKPRNNRFKGSNMNQSNNTYLQIKNLKKKYEFMISDFKSSSKNQFFFVYWITAFNVSYILLIFGLQKNPRLQCFSIILLILAAMVFSAVIRPFKTKIPAFLHFFNFTCVLIAAVLNLALSFISAGTSNFFTENQGKMVVSIIAINTAGNTLFSFTSMLLALYKKIRSRLNRIKDPSEMQRKDIQMKIKTNVPGDLSIRGSAPWSRIEVPISQSNGRSLNLSGMSFLGHAPSQSNFNDSNIIASSEHKAGKKTLGTYRLHKKPMPIDVRSLSK